MSPQTTLAEKLDAFADREEFPDRGVPLIRWGQTLRTTPQAAKLLAKARESGLLVPLRQLAKLHSGLVTRANGYFIVEELELAKIPSRFHVTRRDLKTIAVVVDGKDVPHRITRKHLHHIVKGPEALLGPREIQDTNLRLFAVMESQDKLREDKDADTLRYLRRGETVDYRLSEDKMKGGIPAKRSNIKNRKPFWYSLNPPPPGKGRLVVPEHFDQRFIATALTDEYLDRVVIDTCYRVDCRQPSDSDVILASLNSLLTWYQIELRGRTQHGEGVLKVKIPDFEGILVPDPTRLSDSERSALLKAFDPVANRRTMVVHEELESPDRVCFDEVYLRTLGIERRSVTETRILIARELREAMAERRTRPESVAELKAQRTPKQRVNRAVDAFSARIVSRIPPYPDPRQYISPLSPSTSLPVNPFEGPLHEGIGLFDSTTVYAGTAAVAVAESPKHARFVRAVLTLDPQLREVDIPIGEIDLVLEQWSKDVNQWYREFEATFKQVVQQIEDPRIVTAVRNRALEIAHASEIPAVL